MNDAVTGGHPLRAAWAETAVVAEAVAMLHRAVDHVRHGFETTVRMRGKAGDVVTRNVRMNLIEQEKGIEHGQGARSERAVELDARALRVGWALTSWAIGRSRGSGAGSEFLRRFGVLGSRHASSALSRGNP